MLKKLEFLKLGYDRKALFLLFTVCAFPLHIWAILMAFRDFAWVAERTYLWDGIGLIAYALTFAFIETVGTFLIVVLAGLLVPRAWEADKRTALIGTLFLVLAAWSILYQVFLLFGSPVPAWGMEFLTRSEHPLRVIWGVALSAVAASVVLPAWSIVFRERAGKLAIDVFERIAVASSLYLVLDALGILVIVIRNLTTAV